MNSKVSVVIPCYNEAESIAQVIANIPKTVYEILVIDNNCTDDTKAVAEKNGAKVVSETTKGYGAALRTGFATATGDVIVTLDGDSQYPAQMTEHFVEELESKHLDFISCNRFPLQDKKSLPFVRRFGNFLFTLATNILFNTRLKDSQSGMWIFRRSILTKIKLVSDDMPLSEEIKIKALHNRTIKFVEYSIPYYERVGESKLFPLKHGIINLAYLLRLRFEFWLEKNK